MKSYRWLVAAWLGVAVLQQAVAESGDQGLKCLTDCVPVGQWQVNVALGLGVRQNPLLDKSDTPLVVLPEVSYYGERFFLKNLEFGFTLFESHRHQLHLLATPSLDQMYFNRWDPLNFTDSASFASSFPQTSSLPPTPVSQPSRAYAVTVNETLSATMPVTGPDQGAPPPSGFPPPPSAGSSSSGGAVASPLPADDTEGFSDIRINQQIFDPTTDSQVIGRSGNTITLNLVDSQTLEIYGLSEEDELVLYGVDYSFTEGVGGEQTLSASRSSGDDVAIRVSSSPMPEPDRGDPLEQGPPSDGSAETITREIRRRRLAGLAGFEYLYSRSWVNLHVQGLTDVTGVHDGQEWRLAMIFPGQYRNHRWAATLGANYQSHQVLDYYYGLSLDEVADAQYAYQVERGGWSHMLRLDWQMALNRRWSLRAMAQYRSLADEIHHSPMVSESGVASIFVGGVYHF